MTIPIFANSAGWKAIGPRFTARYAPFDTPPIPGTRGRSSRTSEAVAMM
jgi:hypothetical protein